jgi:O-antigen/teichoic acid export membrane protein
MEALIRIGLHVNSILPGFLQKYVERLRASEIACRLVGGASWLFAGSVISRGATLISFIIIARIVGKEQFGMLGVIQSTVAMFQIFVVFGAGVTASRYVSELCLQDRPRTGRVIVLSRLFAVGAGFVMAAILFLFSSQIATRFLAARNLTHLLQVGALLLFLTTLNGAETGALSGFQSFGVIARTNFIGAVAAVPITIAGAYWKGVEGVVWGLAISMGVIWLLNFAAVKERMRAASIPSGLVGCWKELRILSSFSLPAVLSSLLTVPIDWVCVAMLVHQPRGYSEMGVYNVASQWRQLVLFLPSLLIQVMLPVMSQSRYHSYHARLRAWLGQMKISFWIILYCSAPIVFISCILSPWIMTTYGRAFSAGWPAFVLGQTAALLQALQAPMIAFLTASGRMWTIVYINVLLGSVLVGTSWMLVGKGALGLMMAVLVGFIVHSFVLMWIAYRAFFRKGVEK